MLTKKDTVEFRSIINQLVAQQFFIPPNLITDRTHRIHIRIQGAEIVYKRFTDFLYEITNHLYGTEPFPYIKALFKAGEVLNLENSILKERFQSKAGSFLNEGLATEIILFITTVATILEILDIQHYQEVLEILYSSFKQFSNQSYDSKKDQDNINIFDEGIKRLGEVADSNFSILLNIIKLMDLAKIFNLQDQVTVHPDNIEVIKQKVLQKIISEEY